MKMAEDDRKNIETKFEEALWTSCRESRTLGYKPIAFEAMLGREGAVETAHRLLATFEYQDGFRRLWELGRLDLSLECHVLRPNIGSCSRKTNWTRREHAYASWTTIPVIARRKPKQTESGGHCIAEGL